MRRYEFRRATKRAKTPLCWCCKHVLWECMCWVNVGPTFVEHCEPSDHVVRRAHPANASGAYGASPGMDPRSGL